MIHLCRARRNAEMPADDAAVDGITEPLRQLVSHLDVVPGGTAIVASPGGKRASDVHPEQPIQDLRDDMVRKRSEGSEELAIDQVRLSQQHQVLQRDVSLAGDKVELGVAEAGPA